MADQSFNSPAGPNELHPIRGGMDQEGFQDFRAKAPEQTAFESYLQETAFSEQQRAEKDAKADAEEWLNGREPETAFELEMSGGRPPLDVQESAQGSLLDEAGRPALQENDATVEKVSKSPQSPTPPSASSPNPGPSEPSVPTITTPTPSSPAGARPQGQTKQSKSA